MYSGVVTLGESKQNYYACTSTCKQIINCTKSYTCTLMHVQYINACCRVISHNTHLLNNLLDTIVVGLIGSQYLL